VEKVVAGIKVPARHETAVFEEGFLAHPFFSFFCLGGRVVVILLCVYIDKLRPFSFERCFFYNNIFGWAGVVWCVVYGKVPVGRYVVG